MEDKKTRNPSFPSNYVTLAQLQERWLREKERKQREEREGDPRLDQKGLRDEVDRAVKVVAESKPPSRSPEVEVAGDGDDGGRETKTTGRKKKSQYKAKKKGKSQRELNITAQDAVAVKEALEEPPFSNAEKDGAGGDTGGTIRAETGGLDGTVGVKSSSGVSSSNRGSGRGGFRRSHGRRATGGEAGEARALSHNLEEKTDSETKSRVLSVNVVIKEEDERLLRRNDGGGYKEDELIGNSRKKGRDKGEATTEGNVLVQSIDVQSPFKAFPRNGERVRKTNTWKWRDKGTGTSRETRVESREGNEDSARRARGEIELQSNSFNQTTSTEQVVGALPVDGNGNDRSKRKDVSVRKNKTMAGNASSDLTAEIEPGLRDRSVKGLAWEGSEGLAGRDKKQDMVWRRTGGKTKPKSDSLDQTTGTEPKARALPVIVWAGKMNNRSKMKDVPVSNNEEGVGGRVETRAGIESSDPTAEIEPGLCDLNEGSARRDKKQEKWARQTGGETKLESNSSNPPTVIQEVRAFPVNVGAGKGNDGSRKKGVPIRRNIETKAESVDSDQLVDTEPKFEVFPLNIVTEKGIGFETMAGSGSSDPMAEIEPDDVARKGIEGSRRRGKEQDMYWRKTGESALDQMAGVEHKVRALPINGWAGKRPYSRYGRGFGESQSSHAGRFRHRGMSHREDSVMVWVKKGDV